MKSNLTKLHLYKIFIFITRISFGCLFIWSGLLKIRQPYIFLSSIYDYGIVGPKVGILVAMVLPWLEVILGCCLAGGILVSGSFLTVIILFTIFTFNFATVLYQGLKISCGCFGSDSSDVITYLTLMRSCLMLAVCVIAYVLLLISHSRENNSSSKI